MKPPPRDCPCHSDLRYNACCGPFHDGADDAERSTFVREAGVWRYVTGELVPRTELPEDVDRSTTAARTAPSRSRRSRA